MPAPHPGSQNDTATQDWRVPFCQTLPLAEQTLIQNINTGNLCTMETTNRLRHLSFPSQHEPQYYPETSPYEASYQPPSTFHHPIEITPTIFPPYFVKNFLPPEYSSSAVYYHEGNVFHSYQTQPYQDLFQLNTFGVNYHQNPWGIFQNHTRLTDVHVKSSSPIDNSCCNDSRFQATTSLPHVHICKTKPLSHFPTFSGDTSAHSSMLTTSKLPENIFLPTINAKTGSNAEMPLCLKKEASLSERVKAQVDDFIHSTLKKQEIGSCHIRGRKIKRSVPLTVHLRQPQTEKKRFKCDQCSKSFIHLDKLNSHLRSHTEVRPFSCSYCHKSFAHSSGLKTHTRIHTGERPHHCPVLDCGMRFSDISTLVKHARVHSGERPYSCDVCGRRFSQSGNVHKHRRAVHEKNSKRKRENVERSSQGERDWGNYGDKKYSPEILDTH